MYYTVYFKMPLIPQELYVSPFMIKNKLIHVKKVYKNVFDKADVLVRYDFNG